MQFTVFFLLDEIAILKRRAKSENFRGFSIIRTAKFNYTSAKELKKIK